MIGPKTIDRMKNTAVEKIEAWAPNMRDAFLKSDDGKLKVTIGFTIFVSKETPGGLDVKTGISFTAEKINDETISTVVENQIDLPLEDHAYPLKDMRKDTPKLVSVGK
jgi:predicted RNA-binding protein with TRAM domain